MTGLTHRHPPIFQISGSATSQCTLWIQVNSLPHPFDNVHEFEKRIQQPIGRTWNSVSTFKKLTKPKVVTRLGKVIAPIQKSDAFKKVAAERTQSARTGGETGSRKRRKTASWIYTRWLSWELHSRFVCCKYGKWYCVLFAFCLRLSMPYLSVWQLQSKVRTDGATTCLVLIYLDT